MRAESTPKPRPYWHVDAKWVTGLLLVFVLSLTLLVFNLVQITAEKPAVDALSMWFAISFSRQGLDDETEIAEMRKKIEASPDKSLQPLPNLRIIVREEDFAGLTPRQARLRFFRMWAEPLYREGPQGFAALATDPKTAQDILQGIGPIGVLSAETHQALQRLLTLLAIVCGGLLLLLLFFSYRFGRVGSPGCVLFVASLPCALLFGFVYVILGTIPSTPPPQGEDAGPLAGPLGQIVFGAATNVLPPLVSIVLVNYLVFLALGFGLVTLALVSNFVWWLVKKRRASHQPAGMAS